MKKVILNILIYLIFLSNVCLAAQDVQIVNYGVDEFIEKYNSTLNQISIEYNIAINTPSKKDEKVVIDDYVYTSYTTSCGNPNDGIITINFLVTDDDYISKIILSIVKKNDDAAKLMGAASALMLLISGLNQTEFEELFAELDKSSIHNASHWCSATNRYLKYKIKEDNNHGYVIISAELR